MNENQVVCNALTRMRESGSAWVTLRGRRFKIVPAVLEEIESGTSVLLATRRGYEAAEVSHRKGPHTGLPRWRAETGRANFWTSAKAIRAKIVEGYARPAVKSLIERGGVA